MVDFVLQALHRISILLGKTRGIKTIYNNLALLQLFDIPCRDMIYDIIGKFWLLDFSSPHKFNDI